MSTTQTQPSTEAIVASIALKIITLLARTVAYTPQLLFIIFGAIQIFMSLAILAGNTINVFGVALMVLLLLVLAPIMISRGSFTMEGQISSQEIALSIGFWLIAFAVFDIVIRKIRHKPLFEMAHTPWVSWKTILIYSSIYLISTGILLVSQPEKSGETIVAQITFYVFGIVCYAVSSIIKKISRTSLAKSDQLMLAKTTLKL